MDAPGGRKGEALVGELASGRLTDADVATIAQLMVESPVPVDDAHVGETVDA